VNIIEDTEGEESSEIFVAAGIHTGEILCMNVSAGFMTPKTK